MAVFLVIRHGRDEILVAFHPGFLEILAHFAFPIGSLFRRHAKILLEIPADLRHDLVRPFRKV
jgi:hypothetical protein